MKKSKQEIKQIANYITTQEGKYMFSQTEICKLFGVCRYTARDICENLAPITQGRVKKYFILDVLEYLYSEKH